MTVTNIKAALIAAVVTGAMCSGMSLAKNEAVEAVKPAATAGGEAVKGGTSAREARKSCRLRLANWDNGKSEALTAKVKEFPGVSAAKVTKTGTLAITYSVGSTTPEKLLGDVKNAGYEVKAEEVYLKIRGLTGKEDADKVAKACAELEGVEVKTVNPKTGMCFFLVDPAKCNRQKVEEKVGSAGFKAG